MSNEYATGPGRFWQQMCDERRIAESVPCRYCGAAAGQTCVNPITEEPLAKLPAHLARLRDAGVQA